MPLTQFEECWPLPMESLPELPKNLNIVFLVDCLSSGNPVHVDHASAVKKRDHHNFVGGFALSGLLGSGKASMLPLGTLSLGHAMKAGSTAMTHHSSRSSFHRMAFFPSLKHNFIGYRSSKVQIAFLKFTSCDNQ